MKLRKIPDISVVYKSKETEMLQRKDIIEKVEEFLTNGDATNSKESKRFDESFESTKYAYVAYLYGDGGIGKTYICKMLQEQISTLSQESQVVYKIYYDLAKRGDFPAKIADLSVLIKDCFDNQEIFPIFNYAYNVYISKVGERQNNFKEQVSSERGVVDTAISIVSCIPGLSNAADVVTAGKNIFSLIQKYKKNKQTIENFHIIDKLPLEELKVRLDWYFAKDLNNYFEQYPEVRLIVILDTFENFIYRDLKNGKTLNPTEWLFGKTGIIRLLQNTFWVIAGREDIDWKLYDSESHEITFRKIKVEKPDRLIVEQYLVDAGLDSCSAKEITKSTHCYPLHFGMCLDLFFKSWNEHLQEYQKSIELLDDCKPGAGEVAEIIQLVKDSSIVSDRVLGYFNKQERDVIFTLACLKQWNDDILSEVIWKHFPSNFTFYESIKGFSFIKKQGDIYEFQTDTLQELVINCPNLIKRNLISSILTALGEEGEFYHLLVQSLVHITLYYQTEMNSWGTVLEYLYEGMYSFLRSNLFGVVDDSCEKFLRMLQDSNQDGGNISFKFSIWVWKYISSVVQESLNKTEIVVVDYFHLSKSGGNEFTSDDCFREMEQIIKPMTQEDIPKEFVWATNAVYQWLSIYGLYREAYDFMQLILSKFNQPMEEIFYKYEVYQVAVLADAKLCYLSWNKYEGISKDLHTIEAENVKWVLKKLEVLIEYISENNRNLEEELKYLITSYIGLIKPLMTRDKSKIVISDSRKDYDSNVDKFLKIYKNLMDSEDTYELMELKLLECRILENVQDYDTIAKTAFQGLYIFVSEYGIDLNDFNILERLISYIAISCVLASIEDNISLSKEEISIYKKVFYRIVQEFCKTLNLEYFTIIRYFEHINTRLFKELQSEWITYIFQFSNNNSDRWNLQKRIILMIMYT